MKPALLLSTLALLALATTHTPRSFAANDEPSAGRDETAGRGRSLLDSALEIGTQYCVGVPNSLGAPADLEIFGNPDPAVDAVALHVTGLPTGSYGVFLTSRFATFLPAPLGSSGNVCVRRDLGRFLEPGQVKRAGLLGTITLDTTLGEWTTQAIPRSVGIYAAAGGGRSHFQLWYRDNVGGVATSNFSDGEFVDWQ